jgi:hypothetical protein
MPPHNVLCDQNEVDMEIVLSAMAYHPTLQQTSNYLLTEHGMQVSVAKLGVLQNKHWERYEKVRAQLAGRIETGRAHDMLGVAGLCTEVEQAAIVRTSEMLAEDRIQDPSKVARDLADVKAKNIDKKLALESRPSQIVETRNTDEIIRALEGMNVVKRVEITQGEAEATNGDAS